MPSKWTGRRLIVYPENQGRDFAAADSGDAPRLTGTFQRSRTTPSQNLDRGLSLLS
jgi:hypothetical protein